MGIMQVMPQTYTEIRARYRLGPDPFDPYDNIQAGAAYLRRLKSKYA
jgi:soluble lytic murein transglycosylase-like protein